MSSFLHKCAGAVTVLALGLPVAGQQPPAFRAGVNTVPLFVSVADRGGYSVRNLTQKDFVVLDNGAPRPITVFSADPPPVTAVLMLDMGVSMDVATWLQAAGETFVAALRPGDRARIGTFGNEVFVSPLLTGDKGYLLHVLHDELWPTRYSPLWAAFDEGMSSLSGESGRRVVIVFTGGSVTDAGPKRVSDRDVARRAEREGFTLFAVAIREWGSDRRLVDLTGHTGGRLVPEFTMPAVGRAFGAIVDELHAQYTLGFVPAPLDGQPHDIEVLVNFKNLIVRARRSYVAPMR